MIQVPLVDLRSQYLSIREEIRSTIEAVFDRTEFVQGKAVNKFENQFACNQKVKHCIGCGSGTDALHLILWALEIGPQDEVIVPVNTFIATAEAISLLGAKPVFAEVDQISRNIDIEKLGRYITSRTKAVIPVHLYGQAADMEPLLQMAQRYNFYVVEDACQAHSAEYKGRRLGNFGIAAAFSFYPGKNLGAYGEAGAVTTNDDDLAKKIRSLQDHGQQKKYHHDLSGHNYRMDEIQGAVLCVKLRYLEDWTEKRRRNAISYNRLLSKIPEAITTPTELAYARHVYHLYVVRSGERDDLQRFLADKGISTGLHYPIPLHLQKAFSNLGGRRGDFPVAEALSSEILSLPMYAELNEEQIEYVANNIALFYQGSRER